MYLFYLAFLIVLILYFHVVAYFKKSDISAIYETDWTDASALNTSCKLQPLVIFGMDPEFSRDVALPRVDELASDLEMAIVDTDEWVRKPFVRSPEDEITREGEAVRLGKLPDDPADEVTVADEMMEADKEDRTIKHLKPYYSSVSTVLSAMGINDRYISTGNRNLLEESGMWNRLKDWSYSRFCKKTLGIISSDVDLWMGSKGACSVLQYHRAYRRFLVVKGHGITVRLTPFKNEKYLAPLPSDPTLSPVLAFTDSTPHVKFAECFVPDGGCLYVPPFWWYSVQFSGPQTAVYCFTQWNAISFIHKMLFGGQI